MSLFAQSKPKDISYLYEVRDALLKADEYSCDLETTGFSLEEDVVTLVALAAGDKGWALKTSDFKFATICEVLKPVFESREKLVVFHNANFDIKWFHRVGYYFFNQIADTMIMAWLCEEDVKRNGGYGLKHCVFKELNHKMVDYEEATSLFGDLDSYAEDDAVQTLRLFYHYKEKLIKLKVYDWFMRVEMPICQLLIETETWGVALDKEQLRSIKKQALDLIDEYEEKIHKLAGYKFNVASGTQLALLLFSQMKIGMRPDGTNEFTTKGKTNVKTGKPGDWSTNEEVMKAIMRSDTQVEWPPESGSKLNASELAVLILQYREINTRLNNFIKPLLERRRFSQIIHPRFIQVGTVTGRFASKDPNYQNLPRKGGVRKAFIAREGYKIVKADYSQAELRLMAHMSRDPIMIGVYRENGDIHQITADACGVERQAAKAINFGLIYRMSANRLKGQLAMQGIQISIQEAYKYVDRYFKTYKKVKDYHSRVEKVVKQRLDDMDGLFKGEFGYIRTLGGRYRRLDRMYLTNPKLEYSAITQTINTTIQGGVADMIKVGMVDIWNELRASGWLDPSRDIWDAVIQGQVHDEVFIECKTEIAEQVSALVQEKMVNVGRKFKIIVPMLADAEIVDTLAK